MKAEGLVPYAWGWGRVGGGVGGVGTSLGMAGVCGVVGCGCSGSGWFGLGGSGDTCCGPGCMVIMGDAFGSLRAMNVPRYSTFRNRSRRLVPGTRDHCSQRSSGGILGIFPSWFQGLPNGGHGSRRCRCSTIRGIRSPCSVRDAFTMRSSTRCRGAIPPVRINFRPWSGPHACSWPCCFSPSGARKRK